MINCDEYLKFSEHLDIIKKKVSSEIYLLSGIRQKMFVDIAKTAYESSVQNHFD